VVLDPFTDADALLGLLSALGDGIGAVVAAHVS
jgi:hypothetical protein